MLIKIVLNLIIVYCSTLLGNRIAGGYVSRVRKLHILQGAIARLETEIIYYSTILPEALERVGHSVAGDIGKFLCDVSSELTSQNDSGIEAAWQLALDKNRSNLMITEDDYEIINRFGSQLGTADKMGQRQLFKLMQMQLQRQQDEAEGNRLKYEKMYRSLGFLSGLTIVIILF